MTARFSREYGAKLAKAQDDRKRQHIEQAIANAGIVTNIKLGKDGKAAAPPKFRLVSDTTKYGNAATDGYASKREAKRAADLLILYRAGKIRNLKEQVPFLLIPKQDGERACSYVADFTYDENGQAIVEDCKGARTDVYRIKRKLMLLVHKIRIRET